MARGFACVVFALCGLLSGCTTPDLRREQVSQLATRYDWKAHDIDAGQFTLRAFAPRELATASEVTIYIEGDGQAWVTESQPSSDPTPSVAMALELAIHQPEGIAVYLARPCQFVEAEARKNCRQTYWTEGRFAPEVVAAMDNAVSHLMYQLQATQLQLVGYSGGGAIAALLSARRKDVKRLITVAGNLDHVTWVNIHRISPLSGSLNPTDSWRELSVIEQVHFRGSLDRIMPEQVASSYRNKFSVNAPIDMVNRAGFDHHCCWVNAWPALWQSVRKTQSSGPLQ
jgi:dienelactone hydrolase